MGEAQYGLHQFPIEINKMSHALMCLKVTRLIWYSQMDHLNDRVASGLAKYHEISLSGSSNNSMLSDLCLVGKTQTSSFSNL